MKIKTLIKKLQKLADKHGNLPITVHSDNTDEFKSPVNTITWFEEDKKTGKPKATEFMIADSFTVTEFGPSNVKG